jgi:hypothetical protein
MKIIFNAFKLLSIASLAAGIGACGSGNNSNPPPAVAPGTVVTGTCVYTQVGLLPQGSCPAGEGQIITMANGVGGGYTQGQCLPQVAGGTNGVYGNTGYPNTGGYPGYGNTGYGYGNTGYGNTGYGTPSPYANGQCTGQTGVNGINNGQCVQTQFGCLPQCPNQPGTLQYEGNCAPYSYFGVTGVPGQVPGGVIPPFGAYGNPGAYGPGYYPPGYVPGGGGNFGGYYYYGARL